MHGDLWIGNVGATAQHGPVVFDPACFFGHSEYDLRYSVYLLYALLVQISGTKVQILALRTHSSIMQVFVGFSAKFFEAYHTILLALQVQKYKYGHLK